MIWEKLKRVHQTYSGHFAPVYFGRSNELRADLFFIYNGGSSKIFSQIGKLDNSAVSDTNLPPPVPSPPLPPSFYLPFYGSNIWTKSHFWSSNILKFIYIWKQTFLASSNEFKICLEGGEGRRGRGGLKISKKKN